MDHKVHFFRPFWNRYLVFDWRFGLFLLSAVCLPRFILVLHANQTGSYQLIGLVMLISALVPFVFLTRQGRNRIGIKTTGRFQFIVFSLVAGVAFSLLLHYLGQAIYGNSYQNWYAYIGKSYAIPEGISLPDKQVMFMMMALIGMTFSPIGEEFFFRGIVHESFAQSLGTNKASFIDSLAFAITHLSHFGIVYLNGGWYFYPVAGLIWVISMFAVSILFIKMKKLTGSIWGAVLCHSGFNLGMIYCIFYLL